MNARPRSVTFACLAFLALTLLPTPASGQHFDVLIRGGQVLDGSGSPAFTADVGINDDQIVAIGKLPDATATRVIDAAGKYVVPGFIDMHSHADRVFASDDVEGRRAHNLVMQGITTSVFGPDGRNPVWPIADEMDAYRAPGVATNVVPMVGHATVRGMVMGDDYERPATEAEIAEMAELVRAGMEDGAWGLGAGPEYRPGRSSTTEELIALAREVAPYDGFYYSHQRSQSPLPLWQIPSIVDGQPLTGTDGMRETIQIGRATGIRVVGMHIKAKGTDTWGHSATDGFVSLETRPGQHPRSYGAFTRKIAHYVKERGAITLPFAIRSSTGLPARIVGLKDRGYVREGFKADIVVLDYDDITSPATIMEPDLYPDGIEYVMVNGRFTVDGGELTGALPGAVLDRRRRDAATRGVSQ